MIGGKELLTKIGQAYRYHQGKKLQIARAKDAIGHLKEAGIFTKAGKVGSEDKGVSHGY